MILSHNCLEAVKIKNKSFENQNAFLLTGAAKVQQSRYKSSIVNYDKVFLFTTGSAKTGRQNDNWK